MGLWRVTQKVGIPLEGGLPTSSYDMPHTVNTVIRYREMIDSFNELPKDKRPPESIWFSSERLEAWFDDVFRTDSHSSSTIELNISEVEG